MQPLSRYPPDASEDGRCNLFQVTNSGLRSCQRSTLIGLSLPELTLQLAGGTTVQVCTSKHL